MPCIFSAHHSFLSFSPSTHLRLFPGLWDVTTSGILGTELASEITITKHIFTLFLSMLMWEQSLPFVKNQNIEQKKERFSRKEELWFQGVKPALTSLLDGYLYLGLLWHILAWIGPQKACGCQGTAQKKADMVVTIIPGGRGTGPTSHPWPHPTPLLWKCWILKDLRKGTVIHASTIGPHFKTSVSMEAK